MLKVLVGSAGLPAEHHMALGHEEGPVQQLIHGWRRLVEGQHHNAACLRHLYASNPRASTPCHSRQPISMSTYHNQCASIAQQRQFLGEESDVASNAT